MKFTNMRAFEKHIEEAAPNHFSSLYIIIAEDIYQRKMACDALTKALLGNTLNRELALKTLEGEGLSPETLMSELNATSFFVTKSIVLVQNADKLKKSCTTSLEAYFFKNNPLITLVLAAEDINIQTNFYKKGEKAGIILDIAEEKPWEKEKHAVEWIAKKCAKEKKNIATEVCQYIVKTLGPELSSLDQEVEKLFCYVGERQQITIQDVSCICSSNNVETIWQLGEAIFKKQAAIALRISKGLLAVEGSSFFSLIKQIRFQFETDYQVCEILKRCGSSLEVSQQFPYMKGVVLDRHVHMAQHYGMDRFKKGLIKIDEAVVQAKNSSIDLDLLLEMLIIKLAA